MAAKKTKKVPQSPTARQFQSLPAADPYEMTDAEVRLQIARDNLAKYGNTIGPELVPVAPPAPFAKAPRQKREREVTAEEAEEKLFAAPRKARAVSQKWFAVEKKCPHCEKTKKVMPDFGVVVRRGVEAPAGWCKQCRSQTDYRQRDRVYKVK